MKIRKSMFLLNKWLGCIAGIIGLMACGGGNTSSGVSSDVKISARNSTVVAVVRKR